MGRGKEVHEQDFWWLLARATVGMFAKSAFRVRVAGARNIPSLGGALLAYNHVSVIDAVFVGLPVVDRGRIVRFLGLSEDFERPVMGWALRKVRQIPIRRGMGDWAALQEIADVVGGGWLGGIAPEGSVGDGTRLLPGNKGVARIALLSRAPVIPVGIWGTQRRWPKEGLRLRSPVRPGIGVSYGAPIIPEGNPKHRPDVQAMTDRIMAEIGEQVASARRLASSPHGRP
jgi:1-acyl-sn-glycerol-3-phosphate acyltransferase